MNIAAIREGLAANLSTITGLQVSPYLLSNPTPPYAMVHAAETEYDVSFDQDASRLYFGVRVAVAYTGDVGAQIALDEYRAGSRSIKQALESNSDLGGACDDLHVISATPDTFYDEGQIGFETRVEVLT